jgi:hypothetical protein
MRGTQDLGQIFPPRRLMSKWSAVLLLGSLLLAGCGSNGHRKAAKALTVPAYNGFPAITMAVEQGTAERCRGAAEAFVHDAVAFLKPYPSDADVYRVQARLQFMDFKAHLCDVATLRKMLSNRLKPAKRRYIVDHFTFLGETAQELLAGP